MIIRPATTHDAGCELSPPYSTFGSHFTSRMSRSHRRLGTCCPTQQLRPPDASHLVRHEGHELGGLPGQRPIVELRVVDAAQYVGRRLAGRRAGQLRLRRRQGRVPPGAGPRQQGGPCSNLAAAVTA